MRMCSVEGCNKVHLANGYCATHNARYKRHGSVDVVHQKGPKKKYDVDYYVLNTWSRELSWLLGWTITDGCVEVEKRNVVSWMLKDLEPLEIIKSLFKTNKPIETCWKIDRKTNIKKKYYRLRLCGQEVTEKFIAYGILPNKTMIATMPRIPDELLWHFLRGVLEGDGTIVLREGGQFNREGYVRLCVQIISGSNVFLQQLQQVIRIGKVYLKEEDDNSWWVLTFDCSEAVYFLEKVYTDSEGLRLTRKWEKWQAFLKSGQTYKTQAVVSKNNIVAPTLQ